MAVSVQTELWHHHVVMWVDTNILQEAPACIFSVNPEDGSSILLQSAAIHEQLQLIKLYS
jgi:hypothetical protein